MCYSKPADDRHCLAEGRLDDAISHTYDQEQEEGEGVTESVEYGDDNHECLGADVVTVAVLVVVIAPSHQHLDDQKY